MIEGIHLDFTTDELRTHLKTMVEHHLERDAWYQRQSADLRAELDRGPVGSADNDRNTILVSKAVNHRRKAERLQLIAEHLVDSEIYRLDDGDCAELELYHRW